jgi:DNA-binding CsgD family transcriptional regulator
MIDETNKMILEQMQQHRKMLQAGMFSNEESIVFCQLLEKLYKRFLFSLKETYPHLTIQDTQLVILVKMRRSNHEIAQLLGESIEWVRNAKQNLHVKLRPVNNDDG